MSTFDDERRMQPFMNIFYQARGWQADRSGSCRNFDLVLTQNNTTLKIEEKFLFTKEYDQLLIEFIQDMRSGDLGWYYHVDCDYLIWAYCNEDRISAPIKIYLIKWYRFKDRVMQFNADSNTWQDFNVCNKNYGITLNLPFKWHILLDEGIADVFKYSEVVSP